ncbi:255_t:CDS:2, partial [Funneliformis caledonium]
TKRLSATVLRVAPGNNRWIICLNSQPENEIEVSSGRMKFVAFSTTSSDTDQNTDDEERTSDSEMNSEMDISSNTDDSSEDGEVINVSNVNNVRWTNKVVIIDPCQVSRSYSSTPVVHITDIFKATLRQFFERFIPVDFIISVIIPSTNKSARECEHILANDDSFHFAWQFHNEFNENLTKAILPGPYLCMDKSMCQWMGKVDKALADAQINLFLRLDLAEPSECAIKKKFSDQYPATVASMLRLVELWFCSGRTIIADSDITDVLEDTYGSFVSRISKINNVDLTVCSIRNRKNIVLLASYSTTMLGTEVNRYIKGYSNTTFCRPIVFDEYNEFRSAVDILNNL